MRLIGATMVFMLAISVLLISGVAAAGSESPSGVAAGCDTSGQPEVTTDKMDYSPGETVVIAGSGFQCGAALNVTVTWPAEGADSRVDSAGVVADQAGPGHAPVRPAR